MDNIEEVAAALVAAQAELTNPPKTKTAHVVSTRTGGKFEYQYADFADVIDIVRPVFAKNGLAIMHLMQLAPDGTQALVARILHKSGQCMDSVYPVPGGLSAQELGSWMTYMRRYSTCNMAFLAGETDEDGEKATEAQQSVDDEKRSTAKAALEKAKAQGRIKSAYTGETIKPVEEVKPAASEAPIPEPSKMPADDLSMLSSALREALQKAGRTKTQLQKYYVEKGHFPASVKPEDLDDSYLDLLLDTDNWKKAVNTMKGTK